MSLNSIPLLANRGEGGLGGGVGGGATPNNWVINVITKNKIKILAITFIPLLNYYFFFLDWKRKKNEKLTPNNI